MSGLREAADRLRRGDPLTVLSLDRMFASERAAAALAGRRLDDGRRTAPARRLRGALATVPRAPGLIAEALAAERRSLDRAILRAWAAATPADPDFAELRAAAEIVAARNGWSCEPDVRLAEGG